MQMVAPLRCSSRNRSITASPLAESRFPVGSSASRIEGDPDQGARHGHALLLTARELRRIVLHAVRHADFFQRLVHPLLALRRRHAAIGQRQLDVLVDREIADQVERLEDEADLAIADARPLLHLQAAHRLAVQHVLPVGGRVEQAQDGQQRRLAAARRPGDRDIFALLDVHVNARQRVGLHFIGDEDLGHAIQMNQCFRSIRHLCSSIS